MSCNAANIKTTPIENEAQERCETNEKWAAKTAKPIENERKDVHQNPTGAKAPRVREREREIIKRQACLNTRGFLFFKEEKIKSIVRKRREENKETTGEEKRIEI
jgi:hypothetical protein